MIPGWLHSLAIISLGIGLICFLIIAGDILMGHPQKMGVMNWVWPITGLYFGPVAVWSYYAIGRKKARNPDDNDRNSSQQDPQKSDNSVGMPDESENSGSAGKQKKDPTWQQTAVGVSHCGAGCTLGDIIGDWVIFGLGWTIAGMAIWPKIMAEFFFAYLIGIVFQYFAIVPMRHLSPGKGIIAAIKADTLSITAFEVGMFVWMIVVRFVFFHRDLPPTEPVYWLMMQIAMIFGFATGYPMNRWLIKKGWKEAM